MIIFMCKTHYWLSSSSSSLSLLAKAPTLPIGLRANLPPLLRDKIEKALKTIAINKHRRTRTRNKENKTLTVRRSSKQLIQAFEGAPEKST
jgi:hypothetical protein